MRNENDVIEWSRSQKGISNMYPLVESLALKGVTGRQSGLLRMGFTKATSSFTKAA